MPIDYPPTERAYSKGEALEIWKEARARVERGDCDFHKWYFLEEPDGYGFGVVLYRKSFWSFPCEKIVYPITFEDPNFIEARFEEYVNFREAKFQGDGAFHRG